MPRIRKLLIANRGEIACRIARTCRRLGIATATVHASADRAARHVREIGESVELGEAPSSYLAIDRLVAAARRVGADAVHPGYGFASEDPALVQAVEAAGLAFIGPSAATMRRLGDKAAARREARRLGLPVIEGADSAEDDDPNDLGLSAAPGIADPSAVARVARRLGAPLLLKAVAGGGGRGMALLESLDSLEERITAAMREAQQAFGHAALIVERYLPRVRHVEVQIAGDGHGEVIHLHERECTLQRRHQKLIEEAPAARLPEGLREAMLADACRLATAVEYRGLGTVEFIVGRDAYHFLEVNPRLQVEHPVTEAVTGLDLVELQLRIAESARLPLAQADVACRGHAFEARLCAEDPDAGFMPATGRIEQIAFPADLPSLRIESGVASGDVIGAHYDSMIAKLICPGADRDAARRELIAALDATTVLGVATNRRLLIELLQLEATRDSSFHTRLVDECVAAARAANAVVPPFEYQCAAAMWWFRRERGQSAGCWQEPAWTGWRLASGPPQPQALPAVLLRAAGAAVGARFSAPGGDGSMLLAIGERLERVALEPRGDARHQLRCGELVLELSIIGGGTRVEVSGALGTCAFDLEPWVGGRAVAAAAAGELTAPMMGRVVALAAARGEKLALGQTVVVLESMKMELRVAAPFAATLASIRCAPGEMVERGAVLAELVAHQPTGAPA
jgi:3-methylcrotonyl-CoA carboxylase alpha subunit